MPLITSLRFSRTTGAVVVNDEFLNERRRQKAFLSMPQPLLTEKQAHAWGMEAVYAGCGSPGVHQEILDETRAKLDRLQAPRGRAGRRGAPALHDVARIAAGVLQDIVRRTANLRLELYYGFDGDDLNRGYFCRGETQVPIRQEKVKSKALEILQGKVRDSRSPMWTATRGLVFGYDAAFGIHGFHLDITNGNVAFSQDGMEAMGDGRYGAIVALGTFLNHASLPQRREGFSVEEGLYEVVLAAATAYDTFHTTRGDITIALVDGAASRREERLRCLDNHRARLAFHVVQASRADLVARSVALDLLRTLLVEGQAWRDVEARLFTSSSNATALDLVLRGFKTREALQIAGGSAEKGRSSAEKGRGTAEKGRGAAKRRKA